MRSDPVKVRQVLLNLAGNACKFTHSGRVRLRVRRVLEDSAEWLVFEVEDTGVGIEPVQQATMFDPFTQVDSSYTRSRDGFGLGLAITYHLVVLMGGRIEVHSELGVGSTFSVTLPADWSRVQRASDASSAA